jgi:hypothetical protein
MTTERDTDPDSVDAGPTRNISDAAAPVDDFGQGRVAGALRKNAPLLVAVALAFAFGPAISRLLDTYRGVVLQVKDDETLIGLADKPPRGVAPLSAKEGEIVLKDRGSWSARVVPSTTADRPLLALHARFNRQYTGTVIQVDAPRTPTGAATALLFLDDGTKLTISLWGDHLAAIAAGSRVRKEPGSWEPILVDEALDPAPAPVDAITGNPQPYTPVTSPDYFEAQSPSVVVKPEAKAKPPAPPPAEATPPSATPPARPLSD